MNACHLNSPALSVATLLLGTLALTLTEPRALHAQLTADGNQVFTQADIAGVTPEAGDFFGWALDVGDYNGDGFDDLAIGTPYEDVGDVRDSGIVNVLYGSPNGLRTDNAQTFYLDGSLLSVGFDDYFGATLASGDFGQLSSSTVDGFDDLVIGIPGRAHQGPGMDTAEGNTGLIYFFEGSSGGLTLNSGFRDQTIIGEQPGGFHGFGGALLVCDVDADDQDDLIVSAPGANGLAGSWGVVPSTADPVALRPFDFGFSTIQNTGSRLACGDFDGDGRDDVAAGTGLDVVFGLTSGPVFVARGSSTTGLTIVGSQVLTVENLLGVSSFSGFGQQLLAAHLDTDVYADLVLYERISQSGGSVQLIPGSSGGLVLTAATNLGQAQTAIETDEDGDGYGTALAAADFDLDGNVELVLGGPGEDLPTRGENLGEGAILVFPGSPAGPTGTGAQRWTQSDLGRNAEAGDRFGESLARGDFNGDGSMDLAVGLPQEDVSTIDKAGAIIVIFSESPPLFEDGFETGDTMAWTP